VFPEADWHDFWTGMPIKSATEIPVPSSTEKIPVYVKSGSLVPWADVGQFAHAPERRQLSVRAYGNGSMPFSMRTSAKVEGQGADSTYIVGRYWLARLLQCRSG